MQLPWYENKQNKRFRLSNSQLAKLLNTSVSTISHEMEKTAKRIMSKLIHLRKILEDGTIEFEMINIMPHARYKKGIFEFDINTHFIPHVLNINKNFTEYELNYLLSMNSAYSVKLYKLLLQYRNIKHRSFTVEELKNQFGLSNKYDKYNNFKQKIIDPSVSQINEFTDLSVSYEEIKIGRKVEKIEFTFSIKKILPNIPYHKIIDVAVIETPPQSTLESPLFDLLKPIDSQITQSTKNKLESLYLTRGHDFVEANII